MHTVDNLGTNFGNRKSRRAHGPSACLREELPPWFRCGGRMNLRLRQAKGCGRAGRQLRPRRLEAYVHVLGNDIGPLWPLSSGCLTLSPLYGRRVKQVRGLIHSICERADRGDCWRHGRNPNPWRQPSRNRQRGGSTYSDDGRAGARVPFRPRRYQRTNPCPEQRRRGKKIDPSGDFLQRQPPFGHRGQADRVVEPLILGALGDGVVANQLALPTQMPPHQPRHRMEEHQVAAQGCHHVPQVIPSADVRQFVSKNVGKLARVELGQEALGQQDFRSPPSCHGRRADDRNQPQFAGRRFGTRASGFKL